ADRAHHQEWYPHRRVRQSTQRRRDDRARGSVVRSRIPIPPHPHDDPGDDLRYTTNSLIVRYVVRKQNIARHRRSWRIDFRRHPDAIRYSRRLLILLPSLYPKRRGNTYRDRRTKKSRSHLTPLFL